ncbi:hypothetical protein F4861DRAFT_526720 [Xylaria intraflava]|nr:hypothetical protein F4861DRAFT_526720 [Xylaria intraflava]
MHRDSTGGTTGDTGTGQIIPPPPVTPGTDAGQAAAEIAALRAEIQSLQRDMKNVVGWLAEIGIRVPDMPLPAGAWHQPPRPVGGGVPQPPIWGATQPIAEVSRVKSQNRRWSRAELLLPVGGHWYWENRSGNLTVTGPEGIVYYLYDNSGAVGAIQPTPAGRMMVVSNVYVSRQGIQFRTPRNEVVESMDGMVRFRDEPQGR